MTRSMLISNMNIFDVSKCSSIHDNIDLLRIHFDFVNDDY